MVTVIRQYTARPASMLGGRLEAGGTRDQFADVDFFGF
jgi:hypothetical protein